MSNKLDNSVNIDLKKREFMGKVGKYAIGAGMATLMTPTASSAFNSGNPGKPDCNSVFEECTDHGRPD